MNAAKTHAKVIAVCNQKGGVGKSTTAMAIASGLTLIGKKVLIIDSDPQGTVTDTMTLDRENGTLADALLGKKHIENVIKNTSIGDVVPSDLFLAEMGASAKGQKQLFALENLVTELKPKYDLIIIDAPPTLGINMVSAMYAAEAVVIPATPSKTTIDGLIKCVATIRQVMDKKPSLYVAGVLINKVDARSNVVRYYIENIKENGKRTGLPVFKACIRSGTAVAEEAAAYGTGIFQHHPKSQLCEDFAAFIEELTGEDVHIEKDLFKEQENNKLKTINNAQGKETDLCETFQPSSETIQTELETRGNE